MHYTNNLFTLTFHDDQRYQARKLLVVLEFIVVFFSLYRYVLGQYLRIDIGVSFQILKIQLNVLLKELRVTLFFYLL